MPTSCVLQCECVGLAQWLIKVKGWEFCIVFCSWLCQVGLEKPVPVERESGRKRVLFRLKTTLSVLHCCLLAVTGGWVHWRPLCCLCDSGVWSLLCVLIRTVMNILSIPDFATWTFRGNYKIYGKYDETWNSVEMRYSLEDVIFYHILEALFSIKGLDSILIILKM